MKQPRCQTFLFWSVAILAVVATAHECMHDSLVQSEIPIIPVNYGNDGEGGAESVVAIPNEVFLTADRSDVAPTPHHRHRLSEQGKVQAFEKMRFRYFFNVDGNGACVNEGDTVTTYQGTTVTCRAVDLLTTAKRSYILDVLVPKATAFLSNALLVTPVVGNLTIGGSKCGATPGVNVPLEHRTTGVANADYVIYVTANPLSDPTSQTVAWASGCFRDGQGRLVVGHINFVPAALKNAAALKANTQKLDVNTAIHEACHALGYSSPFFSSYGYVDLNGVRQTGGTTTTYESTFGKSVTYLISPRVVREARAYFNCDTINGVAIEDQGGAGTAGSHWEKRILYQEFLTGILSTSASYISSLTLAFFEDTGYYQANYEMAQNDAMTWGKNKSCTFLTEKCDSVANKASGEFCFDPSNTNRYCTADRTSGGYCSTSRYTLDVPTPMRYFTDTKLGGYPIHSDYCPAVLPFSDMVCIEPSNVDSQDIYGNTYHTASRCFESNLIQSDYTPGSEQDTRCFPFSCSVTGAILLNVRSQTVRCPANLQAGYADVSRLRGYKGSIKCPAASTLCADPRAPTPAPTPAPPTPVPTPAPPGYTPAPAPVQRSAKVWYNYDMPTTCADRVACVQNATSLWPQCRALAKKVLDCFGTDCNSDMVNWLASHGYTEDCKQQSALASQCQEKWFGVADLCTLAGSSSNIAVSMVVVTFFALVAAFQQAA